MARKALRASGSRDVSEALIFKTIERQRQIVAGAASKTRRSKITVESRHLSQLKESPWPQPARRGPEPASEVD